MHILLKNNNEEINLNTKNLKKLGNGEEGTVYQYKKYAVKVYDDIQKKHLLKYDDIEKMLKCYTNRILTPMGYVYNVEELLAYFNGYFTKFIDNSRKISSICNISSNVLHNELKILIDDINILSTNKILVNDFIRNENIMYNGKIYFNDPGSFTFDDSNYNNIYNTNIKYLGKAIHHHLFCLQKNSEYIKKELMSYEFINTDELNIYIVILIIKIFEYDIMNIKTKDYISHIRDILDKYESIKNYKYNLLKNIAHNKNIDDVYQKSIKKVLK